MANDAGRPQLDVVVATNRSSRFLPETLASVEAQVGVDCNIVVVDDGAPDPAYIRSCVANVARAMVIRQDPAGPSAARNRGLLECDGPFVAFLDDDDVWEPTKSVKQLTALAQAPDAVACACSGWYIDSEGVRGGTWAPAENLETSAYLSGAAELPRIVTLIFTRAVCDMVGGFDESFRLGEDLDFTWRVLLRGRCVAVPEQLVGYRRHGDSTSLHGAVQSFDETARMFAKLRELCLVQGDAGSASAFAGLLRQSQRFACLEMLGRLRSSLREGSASGVAAQSRWLLRHAPWWRQIWFG